MVTHEVHIQKMQKAGCTKKCKKEKNSKKYKEAKDRKYKTSVNMKY